MTRTWRVDGINARIVRRGQMVRITPTLWTRFLHPREQTSRFHVDAVHDVQAVPPTRWRPGVIIFDLIDALDDDTDTSPPNLGGGQATEPQPDTEDDDDDYGLGVRVRWPHRGQLAALMASGWGERR